MLMNMAGTEKRRDIEAILDKLEIDLAKTNILPPGEHRAICF